MAVVTDLLKSIPYFSGLSTPELELIRELIFEKDAEKGELIILEGEPAEDIFFVASGVVKVFKTSAGGKEQILYLIRPGESVNDVPVFAGGPNPASAQAMVPTVLYGVRKDALEVILQGHPQVALNINKVLAGRMLHLLSLVEDLSFRHVNGRLAKILLEHAGDRTASGPRLTQQEMAAMAGTAREMIGRSLKALEEEGAIRMDRHRVVITDREALEKLAEASS
jgi:CRP/FNR family transcriptional regulator